MKYTKKIIIIIIIILIIAMLISVVYILYEKYRDRTYIGRIESIYNNIVVADCYDGRNRKYRKYRFSTESVLIVNKKGKKIDVSKLNVGDTIEIYLKHDTLIKPTFPEAGINERYITKIKLLNEI